jgi:histidine triad (HIT) family protein
MGQCIFCKIVTGEARSWKVWEDEQAYAFLDIHPISTYHTLVIPKKHYANLYDIPEKELQAVIAGVRHVVKLYEEKLGIKNVQIISNNGRAAQQDVFHLHFHIIPRRQGDGKNIKWSASGEQTKDFDAMIAQIQRK